MNKRVLETIATVVIFACSTSLHADLVTLVAKGDVNRIINTHRVNVVLIGPAVKESSIPIGIGDELRLLFTYDPLLPVTSFNGCGADGIYFFESAANGAVFGGDYTAAISEADIRINNDCGNIGFFRDAFRLIDEAPNGPNGAPIEDLPLTGVGMDLGTDVDSECFELPVSLPPGNFDPIACSFVNADIRLFFRVADPTTGSVRLVTMEALGNVTIELPACSDLMAQLAADVFSLNLQHGISNSLDSKLDAAIAASDDASAQDNPAAINQIFAFINSVEAQGGNKIGDGEAEGLINTANAIIACLSP